jgi:transposase
MRTYTKEKKEHALGLMSAPQNKAVAEVARLTGISEATLYLWRKQAREAGRAVPGDGQNPERWNAADKFAAVLEAAPLGEAELRKLSTTLRHLFREISVVLSLSLVRAGVG